MVTWFSNYKVRPIRDNIVQKSSIVNGLVLCTKVKRLP